MKFKLGTILYLGILLSVVCMMDTNKGICSPSGNKGHVYVRE